MTNKEAIEELKARKEHYEMGDGCEVLVEALEKGIESLENQKSFIAEIEKIRQESIRLTERNIMAIGTRADGRMDIIEIIDKHISKLKGE